MRNHTQTAFEEISGDDLANAAGGARQYMKSTIDPSVTAALTTMTSSLDSLKSSQNNSSSQMMMMLPMVMMMKNRQG